MKKLMHIVLTSVLVTVLIYLGIAAGLILSQRPTALPETATLAFPSFGNAQQIVQPEHTQFAARDGASLSLRHYAPKVENAPLVVIIHGSGGHGGGYTDIAQTLAASGDYEVLLPDLRGHGPNTDTRGDVAYIGQLEDDIADLIKTYRTKEQKIVLLGHSSGGGLVIRFAGGEHGALLDKAVLMAPFLKYNAPTMRENAGGWAHALTRRIIGLVMLNNVGITWFNGLTAVQFNFPKAVLDGPTGDTVTQSYSYRLNTSYAPRANYLNDIAALPDFLLLVGGDDDAFIAQAFEPTMKAVTARGEYEIIPDADHLGLLSDARAGAAIARFLQQ